MNSEPLTRGNAYANDPDFDRLSGRVTYRGTVIGMTLDGWKVKRTVTYIDLGRSAAIDAADPDIELVSESLAAGRPRRTVAASQGQQNAKAARAVALRGDIEACLCEHGPESANAIAERIAQDGGGGVAKARVLDVLRRNPQCFVYHGGRRKTWGLVGQAYTPRPTAKQTTPLMRALRETLATHGPQTTGDLARRIGSYAASVHKSLLARPDWFVVVEMSASRGNVPDTRVWGLA